MKYLGRLFLLIVVSANLAGLTHYFGMPLAVSVLNGMVLGAFWTPICDKLGILK